MLFLWEGKSSVLVGLVKMTHSEKRPALHLHGVGSSLRDMIRGVQRKLENNSSTELPHGLKSKTEIIISSDS